MRGSRAVRGRRTTLILPDAHVPDQDDATLAIFCKAVRDLDPDVWIIGDFLDLECLNRHPPTGDAPPDLAEEYEAGRAALLKIHSAFPSKRRRELIYLEGNHEQRWAKALALFPAAVRSIIPDPKTALGLEALGWKWIRIPYEDKRGDARESQPFRFGNLYVHHGDYWNVHHAAKHLEAYAVSQVYGHTHRAQQVYTTKPAPDGDGLRVIHVTGLPCARRLRAPWRPQPKWTGWTNGFGVVEWIGDEACVYNVVVRNGAAAYGGRVWRA